MQTIDVQKIARVSGTEGTGHLERLGVTAAWGSLQYLLFPLNCVIKYGRRLYSDVMAPVSVLYVVLDFP